MSEYCLEDGRLPIDFLTYRTSTSLTSPIAVYTRDVPIPSSTEHCVVDSTTGGKKGTKLARFDLIPPEPMWALAEHYGKGALKYEDRNWEKGYQWSLNVAALQRHLNLWLRGEDNDQETQSNHLIAIAWHAFALFVFSTRGLGTDDVRRKS